MSMMECVDCHRIADARSFRLCASCGAPMCDDCANARNNRCPECESRGNWR